MNEHLKKLIDSTFDDRWEHAERARNIFDRGNGDPAAAMSALARAFPCLERADGLDPFDADAFVAWSRGRSSGEVLVASFILSVWDPEGTKKSEFSLPMFDVHEALAVWPPSYRTAFLGWASEPWWP